MSNCAQPIPDAPSGIEPEVLSKINALFQEPEVMKTPNSPKQTGATKKEEAWWKNTEPPSADQQVSENITYEERDEDEGPKAIGEDRIDSNHSSEDDVETNIQSSDVDSLPSPESTPITQLVPQPTVPSIIARYIYPAKSRPGTPPPLPARPAQPTLAALLVMMSWFIIELFTDISTDEPAIIEYTPRQIGKKTEEIRVRAQIIECDVSVPINPATTLDKVVGVLALVHVGQDVQRQAIQVMASPKRVRQLLKGHGVLLVEDVYGNQIKTALKDLENIQGA
jgi:hypothetical protein